MPSCRRRQVQRLQLAACLAAVLAGGCASDSEPTGVPHAGAAGTSGVDAAADVASCAFGQVVCRDKVAYTCDATGTLVDGTACAHECVDGRGCTLCLPGTTTCDGNQATYCASDGAARVQFECDSLQGLQCTPEGCVGSCTPPALGHSHVGCDFWPTVTANSVWSRWFKFGLVVTNTTDESAKVTVTSGTRIVTTRQLGPRDFAVVALPWVQELKGPDADQDGKVIAPDASVLARGAAYRLRSTQPVSVLQFSTLASASDQQDDCPSPCLSYSNDASLLIPATSLGTTYGHATVGWHASPSLLAGDFMTITAVADNTQVDVTAKSSTMPGPDVPALVPGEARRFELHQGDVLQMFTDPFAITQQWAGTSIVANKAIQVLTGSPCAYVPEGAMACDHLEESVLAADHLGKRYLVASPEWPSGARKHLLRVHAVADNTFVNFDPSSVQKPVTLNAGESFELTTDADVFIHSTEPFALTQYLVGHAEVPASGSTPLGDPSQTVVVPTSRFLRTYAFATPPGYETQGLVVIASTGTEVRVNDKPVAFDQFEAVGASGMSVARVTVHPNTRYRVEGDQPLGLQLYGFGEFTSFMLPLGIDLRPVSKSK